MSANMLRRICRHTAFWAVLCTCVPLLAQNSGRTGSETDLLRRDEIQRELGLSESQKTQITEAAASGSPGREVFDPFLQRMKETSDEAARTKIREEMQAAILAAREGASGKALAVLDSRQLKLLRSIFIREAGTRALADARVSADLGLTDEQKKQLETLATQRREASAALGFNATEEQRTAFQTEWDGKYTAILTAEQKAKWTEQAALAATPAAATAAVPGQAAPAQTLPGQATPGAPAMVPDAGSAPPPGAVVVSSFGAAAEPGQRAEKLSFNMRYAPWDQVLQDFAAAGGYTLDLTQVPPGTFTHIDSKEYTISQAMDIINGYLQRKGYTLVVKDNFLVSVNVDKTIPPNLIRDVSVDDLLKVEAGSHTIGENEIVRIEIPLEKLDVGVMAQEVEQLLGPLGTMTAFTQTGSLIIADTGSNLRRIKSYVDASLGRMQDELVFKSYYLEHIDVEEAEFMLLAQFGMRSGVTNVSAGAGGDRRGQPPAPTPSRTSTLQVFSDTRTNSLLVTASPEQQKLVEEIIKALDVDKDAKGNPLSRTDRSGPFLKVYKVTGRADQVAQSIDAMMPGVVVNEDGQAGTVHIFGTAKQQEQVAEWVKSFTDGTGTGGSVAVIPLIKMDPLTAAATLRNLFITEGNAAPTIETDLYGNRIIAKGSAVQIEQIRQVLRDLGEDGTGVRTKGEGGNIRRYSLRGRDPGEFFEYLQKEWQSQEQTPIRIVVPNKSGPIRDLKTPSQGSIPEENAPAPGPSAPGSSAPGSSAPGSSAPPREPAAPTTNYQPAAQPGLRKEVFYYPVRLNASTTPAFPVVSSAQPPQDGEPDIRIVVDGDDLLLLSNDEDALDRLEELMDFLQESIPFRVRWTVFYLEVSDATETAALLEQLLPSSSVTSTAADSGFSLSSMFSPITQSVSSMTGLSGLQANPQTLRIIPDPRANALYITGPQAAVDEAESLLRVLDSNDIPESLRELQPRRLEVQYADIDDMASIINDAFKPYLEPAGGRGGQNNPLAAMFGGGGGGGNRNEPQGVQMTVAVDRQTSTLIISSSEALYNKVKALVEETDEAAKTANRTFRVVQLQNADATMVQQSLTSLFPRITTSAARPTSSSTSGGGGGNSGGGNSGGSQQQPPQDPFQQMMQERMRQRSSDSGGGRGGFSPFGGGGASPFGGGASPFGGGGGFSPFGGRGGFGGGGFGGRGGGGR
jgi:type II secretory pathway component GspD/PulD (secretin)